MSPFWENLETFEIFLNIHNQVIIYNYLTVLKNVRTFSSKLAGYFDVIFSSGVFVALFIILEAFEFSSGNT